VNLCCASGPDGVQDTEVYIGSGEMSLRPVRAGRVLALVCCRGYKRTREGMGSQVSSGEVLCGSVSVAYLVPTTGSSPSLLYAKGQGSDTRERGC
jgi:hypothetical protein